MPPDLTDAALLRWWAVQFAGPTVEVVQVRELDGGYRAWAVTPARLSRLPSRRARAVPGVLLLDGDGRAVGCCGEAGR